MKYATKIIFGIFTFVIMVAFVSFTIYKRNEYTVIYNEGIYLLEQGKLTDAIECFEDIPDYINYRDMPEVLDRYNIPVCPHCGYPLE